MLPDFIIIGGMKCGTSSLFYYLGLHPQIGTSDIKEVDYFIKENNYNKGEGWYEDRFRGSFDKFGEASPNYSKAHYFKGVPQRMHALLPDVKLIYLVRDPIDRLLSHYTHNVADGREQQSITEALAQLKNNHYVECSRYYWQLEHYLQYFSPEQILIADTQKLRDDRRQSLQTVFDFLEVDATFYTPEYEQEKHQTGQKRKRGKRSRIILESPVIKSLKQWIPDGVKEPIKKATRSVVEKPKLSADLEDRLVSCFTDDVEALRAFSGQDFASWKV